MARVPELGPQQIASCLLVPIDPKKSSDGREGCMVNEKVSDTQDWYGRFMGYRMCMSSVVITD